MVGGFFAGSKDDFLKYQPKNITGEITVEEVYKEKALYCHLIIYHGQIHPMEEQYTILQVS